MSLQLSEVQTETEFAEVVAVENEAYSKPLNGFWDILKGPSVSECTARQWSWHTAESGSHWLKATDSKTGKVVGAVEWIVHESNPFAKPSSPLKAYWWPEGELKTMSDQVLTAFFAGRPQRMSRPHLLINICFVSSEHRRRGAGRMLLEWGCELADKMELEAFVESTEDGRALYEAMGFVVVDSFYLDPKAEEPSAEWKTLKSELFPKPFRVWFMWRPKGGKLETGETVYS